MDIMRPELIHSLNSEMEEDTLRTVNEALEHLVTDVENLLRNTEFRSSSEWSEEMQNIERENELSPKLPYQSAKERQTLGGKRQADSPRGAEFDSRFSQQPVQSIRDKETLNKSIQDDLEFNTSATDELITNEQSNLSVREETMHHGKKHEVSTVCSKFRTGPCLEKPDHTIREGQVFFPGSQEDISRNAECQTDINSLQPDMSASAVQLFGNGQDVTPLNEDFSRNAERQTDINSPQPDMSASAVQLYENGQDVNPFNEDFIVTSENNEDVDVVRGSNENSDPQESANNEWMSTDSTVSSSTENFSDSRTGSNSEDAQMNVDWPDTDDGGFDEFIVAEYSEEIGDQEEPGDLDDTEFLERIVRFVRETDMMLNANHGAGDIVFDDEDDDDDEDDFI